MSFPSVSRRLRRFVCALLATLLSAAAAAQPASQSVRPRPAQTFQDWILSCDTEATPCYVSQSASLKETGQRVFRVVVGPLGAGGKPIVHLSVPLSIYLPAGVALKIDEGAQLKAEVQTCTPRGCEAMLDLDAALLKSLEGAKVSQVAFLDAVTRRQITMVVSMLGFRNAYAALKQQAAGSK